MFPGLSTLDDLKLNRYMEPEDLDAFMRRMLVSRISRRVLVQHHIALSDSLAGRDGENPQDHVGIIYTQLNVRESVEKCAFLLHQRPHNIDADAAQALRSATWPEVIVDGHLDTKFPYIKEHFEYIVFELLKNVSVLANLSVNSLSRGSQVDAIHPLAEQSCGRPTANSRDSRCWLQ